MKRNALVAQSGGPSPVINASLQGVIEGCRAFPDRIGTLFAAWHGIEGVLQEELVDLARQPAGPDRMVRSNRGGTVISGDSAATTLARLVGCIPTELPGVRF